MSLNNKILLFISFFLYAAAGLFNPLYALFVEKIGGDALTTGIAYSIMPIMSGIGILLIGKLEDKVKNQSKILFFGYLLKTIAYGSYIFITNINQLYILQALNGISYIITTPAYDSLYTSSLNRKKLASGWGNWEGIMAIGTGLAAISGGYLLQNYGFQTLFFTMFCLSGLGFIMSGVLLSKNHSRK